MKDGLLLDTRVITQSGPEADAQAFPGGFFLQSALFCLDKAKIIE
jgi:hypothetical protein